MNVKCLTALLLLAPVFSLAQTQTASTSVSDLFPFAAQSHSNQGEIDMQGGTITGTNGSKLDFKKKDNLKGKCDGRDCYISNTIAPSFNLQWPENWIFNDSWQSDLLPLPAFVEYSAGGEDLVCDWNKNQGITTQSDVYKNIVVVNNCKISSTNINTVIKEKISISGSGILYLAPGNYWMDSLELSGSGSIKPLRDGDINLHIKNKLSLESSQVLGSAKSPVNITYHGNDDVDFKANLTGSLNTKTNLKMSGSSRLDKLIQAKSLELQGSAKLTMLPGTYWLEKFDISGSAEILQPQAGDINLHVKDNVSIKISKLGAGDRRVNISNYNGNVDLGNSLTLYGDLNTGDELDLQGSSKLYGAVRAKSLDLQGSAELYLTPGEYWYEEVELQGSTKIHLTGANLTHLHIKDELELDGSAKINESENPLLIFLYGNKKNTEGDVDLDGSSEVNGYLYVQGEVELQGSAKIYGSVNVVDLEMQGSSAIYYKAFPFLKQLNHYRLSYDSTAENLIAYACADSNCNFYYQDVVKKLHIKDGINNNITDFKSFSKISAAVSYTPKYKKDQCVQFAIHNSSTDPEPSATPGLRCWKDGVPLVDCKLCDQEELPAVDLAGFVFGDITITEQHLEGITQGAILTLDSINGNGSLTSNQQLLTTGSPVSLPLVVSYNQAESISLKIKAIKNNVEQFVKLNLVFVPKSLAWINPSTACVNQNNQFLYTEHNSKCQVLGRAGEKVTLTLQALGENKRAIENYQMQKDGWITVAELNDEAKLSNDPAAIVSLLNFTNEQKIEHKVKTISLIQANVKAHCAAYAVKNGDNCVLMTQGDTAILGRTVPAYLQVTGIAGDITDNVVYAAQPESIKFVTTPSFTVLGFDTNNNSLPSYSSEFAGGLVVNSKLTLETPLGINLVNPDIYISKTETNTGTPLISFNHENLIFIKNKPFSETPLTFPLELTIDRHELNNGASGKTTLASAEDKLRYGFLSIDKLELPVNTPGDMSVHLNYYGSSTDSIRQDIKSNAGIATLSSIFSLTPYSGVTTAKPTGLEFNEKIMEGKLVRLIKVPAHSSEWRGIVEMKADKWLKTYENGLVNPSAELNIINDARKRGNDRVFNRREVMR
ncbi:MAG: hypothetical protein H9917_08320 [Candidatus Oceanisphaera merdipullorum]|nr:hypothetical protein [Candidatus Oceanisphaera merdipullorum]